MAYGSSSRDLRRVRLVVRTQPSQGWCTGSTPVRGARLLAGDCKRPCDSNDFTIKCFYVKMSARFVLAAVLLVVSATLLLAKDLKTILIAPNGTHTIHVPGADILRIRNFTQQDGS